jgi:hypothetical protein
MLVVGADGARWPASVAWRGIDVLVLSPTPTHPQDYGNRKRIFSVCSRLAAQGARITFVHYPSETEWRRRVPAAATAAMARAWHAYYTVPVTRPLQPMAQSADHTIDEWWDEAIGGFLRWLFRVAAFDVFIVNYSWLSKAFEAAPHSVVKILDTHDRLAGRRALLAGLGIMPEYFHTTDEEEAIALNRADVVWAIKEQERDDFARLTARPVLSLPHLDPVRPMPIPAPDPEGYLRVGMIGAYNSVNLTNFRDFLSSAIPIFERSFAPLMIHIAGGVCGWLRGADERFVRLVGRVEQVEEFYRGVDLICVAMSASTGLKTKTGEALALGLPVVSLAHGFEGYVATHPWHRLATFELMAERLVDIAFDRDLLSDLRAASLSSADASEAAIGGAMARTWQIVTRLRRVAIFCASAVAFDEKAPEHSAFVSAVHYLGEIADTIVLVVAGSIEPLLRGCDLLGRTRVVVAAPLVNSTETVSKLQAEGLGVAAIGDVLGAYRQKIVIVDALSQHLLEISSNEGMVVLRVELLAQRAAIEPQIDAIGAFLRKFARRIVMAPRVSPILGVLAARSGAEIVTAPCCWRSAETRRQFGRRRQDRRVLLLTDGHLYGLDLLPNLLRAVELEPIFATPLGPDVGGARVAAHDRPIQYLPAPQYLGGLIDGKQALPDFVVDLSFGALGLQYLRELLLRLGVPTIHADATVVHPSVAAANGVNRVHTYEGLAAKILSAARGAPLIDEPDRRRLELELEGDGGWAWLSRYGFDGLGLGDLDQA